MGLSDSRSFWSLPPTVVAVSRCFGFVDDVTRWLDDARTDALFVSPVTLSFRSNAHEADDVTSSETALSLFANYVKNAQKQNISHWLRQVYSTHSYMS